jgi:hypothetical protein
MRISRSAPVRRRLVAPVFLIAIKPFISNPNMLYKSYGSAKVTGGPPGLQIRCGGLVPSQVGSIPMHFRHLFQAFSACYPFHLSYPFALELENGDDRWTGIGMMSNGIVVVSVFTERDQETIRIISMRKATKNKRTRYGKAVKHELGKE